jgi:RND superfamily putative drug exporter
VFSFLGRFTFRYRIPIIAIWALLFLAAAPFLLRIEDPLKVGGFSSPSSEASQTAARLETELGFSPSTVVMLYRSETLTAADEQFHAEIKASLINISRLPNVTGIFLPSQDPSLVAPDGRTAYALVGLNLPPEQAQRDMPAFRDALRPVPDLDVLVAGGPAFYADIETVSQRDLRRAEVIAFPFALAALLLVFGSVVSAIVPLVVGGLGVSAILLTIYGIAQATDLSIFVLNLATMLGLGLAVDYSLFITSRFREELRLANGDVQVAVERTVVTAGRAIFFSGLTVLIGLSGLALFDFMFLRSVGIAGVVVVFISVLAALTLLPALLGVIGVRIDRFQIHRRGKAVAHAREGFWSSLSHRVMKHPVLVLVPTLGFLILLGEPFRHVDVSSPDATILPTDLPSRQAFDLLVADYGPGEISPFVVMLTSPTSIWEEQNVLAIYDLTERLKADPRIGRVQSIASLPDGITREQVPGLVSLRRTLGDFASASRFGSLAEDNTAVILAFSRNYPNSDTDKDLLHELRTTAPGGDLTVSVGGGTAEIVDTVDLMYGDFPKAIALIVAATYLVLLILFRSLVLPLKAILMNTLSILASYGALVFVFQDGHFSGLLDFTPLGYVEASLPVIMFCILFGLSMDYEVFLLTRVREEWDHTGDNTASVAAGLQRSGQIITSAALIVVVVTISFVSADVILIKALGLGIALAVALDATIVRALLVPATMRLLGKWNWWLPRWLDRILPRGFRVE